MQEFKNKKYIFTLVIFWITVAFFILTTYLTIFSMYFTKSGYYLFLPLLPFFVGLRFIFVMAAQALLGLVLIILAISGRFKKISKAFLILTGISAVFILFSIMSLSWIVYGVFIRFFKDSALIGWAANGPVIIFQLLFLISAIVTIILIAKKKVIA